MISLNCATPGPIKEPDLESTLNWLPDETGNLFITNETGTDIDIYMNDIYVRSIEKGKRDYILDIPVSNVYGETYTVKVYSQASGELIAFFETVLYPSSAREYMRLFVQRKAEL
jgi:hypothetical protein